MGLSLASSSLRCKFSLPDSIAHTHMMLASVLYTPTDTTTTTDSKEKAVTNVHLKWVLCLISKAGSAKSESLNGIYVLGHVERRTSLIGLEVLSQSRSRSFTPSRVRFFS